MKKLISVLMALLLYACLLPAAALADEAPDAAAADAEAAEAPAPDAEDEEYYDYDDDPAKPDDDPAKLDMNIFYYSLEDSVNPLVLLRTEYVEPGGHPCSVPPVVAGWSGMEWTWYLSPDLTGDPVEPTTFTVESGEDILSFYGVVDSVNIRLHMPVGTVIDGYELDVFDSGYINRGGLFDADSHGRLPTGYFTGYYAAGWADADGNLIDTDATRFYEDTDLWAVEGNFRVTYMYGEEYLDGEGFIEPGTPRHVPAQVQKVTNNPYSDIVTEWIDIAGWVDEDGNPVDPASLTITEDRTFYALTTPKPAIDPEPAIVLNDEGTKAFIPAGYEDLYARVSLVADNNGESGLYIAQCGISDGVVEIPAFDAPGLTVTGVSVALVRSIEDITSPKPDAVLMSYKFFDA